MISDSIAGHQPLTADFCWSQNFGKGLKFLGSLVSLRHTVFEFFIAKYSYLGCKASVAADAPIFLERNPLPTAN